MKYKIVTVSIRSELDDDFLHPGAMVSLPEGSIVVRAIHEEPLETTDGGLKQPESWTFTCLVPVKVG